MHTLQIEIFVDYTAEPKADGRLMDQSVQWYRYVLSGPTLLLSLWGMMGPQG